MALSLVRRPKKPLPEFTIAEIEQLVAILSKKNSIGQCVRAGLVKIEFSTKMDEDGFPRGWMFGGVGDDRAWIVGR